jgi:hypothetical protein
MLRTRPSTLGAVHRDARLLRKGSSPDKATAFPPIRQRAGF